jgi:hypothetical protein
MYGNYFCRLGFLNLLADKRRSLSRYSSLADYGHEVILYEMNDVRETEMHTSEPLIPEPNSSDV